MNIYALVRNNHYDHLSDRSYSCLSTVVAVNANSDEEAAIKLGVIYIEHILFVKTTYLDGHESVEDVYSGIVVNPPSAPPAWFKPQYPENVRAAYWNVFCKPLYIPPDRLRWYIVQLYDQLR